MKKTLIFKDETSNKFWMIETNGAEFTVSYGRIGTVGQYKTTLLETEEKCLKEAEKLIGQKLKKGYTETDETVLDTSKATYYYCWKKGLKKYNKDEYNEAIADFTETIRLDPKYFHAFSFRGRCYEMIGEYDKAIADFTEYLNIPRSNQRYDVLTYRGDLYFKMQEYDLALADFQRVVERGYSGDNRRIARAYLCKGEFDIAIEYYMKEIEAGIRWGNFNTNSRVFTELGDLYHERGNLQKAISYYDEALQNNPENEEAKEKLFKLDPDAKKRYEQQTKPEPPQVVSEPGKMFIMDETNFKVNEDESYICLALNGDLSIHIQTIEGKYKYAQWDIAPCVSIKPIKTSIKSPDEIEGFHFKVASMRQSDGRHDSFDFHDGEIPSPFIKYAFEIKKVKGKEARIKMQATVITDGFTDADDIETYKISNYMTGALEIDYWLPLVTAPKETPQDKTLDDEPNMFYRLDQDDRYPHAEYNDKKVYFESVNCPVFEDHARGKSKNDGLSIVIKRKKIGDLYTTCFYDWMLTDDTAKIFKDAGLTGYTLREVDVSNQKLPYKLWEVVVTGKAKVHLDQGIKEVYHCKFCDYSYHGPGPDYKENGLIIDTDSWDGSDFFKLDVIGGIFITEKVKKVIEDNKLKGAGFAKLKDVSISALNPTKNSPEEYDCRKWTPKEWKTYFESDYETCLKMIGRYEEEL
ncbi:MAG: tetratricopeptide repeat protein [Marinilabiliaceae bacterium]|nr:tetratricopeptide repeat protein [Marinilabiliaceae bacterium]